MNNAAEIFSWQIIKAGLEQSDSDKGPNIMLCREKGIASLVTILDIINQTTPIFKHGQLFDDSRPYTKFGRNPMINNQVKVSKSAN